MPREARTRNGRSWKRRKKVCNGWRERRTIKLKLVAELFNCRFDNADGEAERAVVRGSYNLYEVPPTPSTLCTFFNTSISFSNPLFSLSFARPRLSRPSRRSVKGAENSQATVLPALRIHCPGSALIIKRRWWINFLQNLPGCQPRLTVHAVFPERRPDNPR